MARLRGSTRLFQGGALLLLGLGLLGACHSGEAAHEAGRAQDPSAPCHEDQVREYFCDDLLPLTSSRPAPDPFDNCPSTTDIGNSGYPPLGSVARFDESFTTYTRKRVQPGHSCCYSWCAKVKVADPSAAAPAVCHDPSGMHWDYCMRELEGGTSVPAAAPFDRCPLAISPPEVAVFAAPRSAQLDVAQTGKRRSDKQLAECCYGWCSQMPTGTVLKPSVHPKIK